MAIHVPGYRPYNKRMNRASRGGRSVVAVLSLTAMVDMFTVLTVFLLQNYNPDTGAVLDIPAEVKLPQASKHKEVEPSHVVTISNEYILFEKKKILSLRDARALDQLLLPELRDRLERSIQLKLSEAQEGLRNKLKTAIDNAKSRKKRNDQSYRAVTIQADRDIDFHIIKKVMHTASEAGAGEINFAVLLKDPPPQ